MNARQKVLSAFQKAGYKEDSLFSKDQIQRVLDHISYQNARLSQYDRNVASQLWEQTSKDHTGKVALDHFVETIVKGEEIVRIQIKNAEQQISQNPNASNNQQRMQDLLSYTEDLKYLTIPFGISGPRQSKVLGSNVDSKRSSLSSSTVIFTKNQGRGKGKSTDLKFALGFALLAILIQIIIMYQKHHFYNILVYLSIFAIFLLNYFDHYYMKFVLGNLLLSVVLDILWLILNFREYWNPSPQTQHSSLQYGFLKFIIFMIIGLIILKIVLTGILFKYRTNPENLRKQCTIFGNTFPLDGTQNSSVAKIIKGDTNTYQNHQHDRQSY